MNNFKLNDLCLMIMRIDITNATLNPSTLITVLRQLSNKAIKNLSFMKLKNESAIITVKNDVSIPEIDQLIFDGDNT